MKDPRNGLVLGSKGKVAAMSTKVKKLIHDCDPGQDDAIALMSTLASPDWDVIGVTVVGGNVDVGKCAINARKILTLCGKSSIPVYMGARQPLKRKLVTLEHVFGESGLAGGDDLPDHGTITSKHAVDFLIETLSSACEPIYICATAPLTNLALALQRKPQISSAIEHLVIMGGCVFPEPIRGEMGNITVEGTNGKVEYNFAMDPEAAAIVFAADIKKISLIGLNVTRKVLFNARWQKAFYDLPNQVAHKAADILSVIGEEDKEEYGHLRQTPDDPVRAVHDVVAALYMDTPDIFKTQSLYVKIITDEPPSIAGQSLMVKKEEQGASKYPIDVITDCDPDEVFCLLTQRLAMFGK